MPDNTRPNLLIPAELWGKVRVDALSRCMTVNGVVVELLRERYGELPQAPKNERKVVAKAPEPVVVGKNAFNQFSDPQERIPMSKCKKCFESFPVADMVTEPKSGKLYCKDCVENMRNGQ